MSTLAFYGYGGTGITIPTPVSARHTDVDDECMYGVFVGDLPPDANEQDLVKLFTNANLPVVKCKIIRDAENNSKRYGFVHFQTEELRQRAINEMHGVSVNGQTINVRTQHYRETDRCLVKPGQKKTDIYIGNIPKSLTKYQVREAIADWGLPKIQDVKVFKNDTGMFCFISFATEGEVSQVMAHLKDNPKLLAVTLLRFCGVVFRIMQFFPCFSPAFYFTQSTHLAPRPPSQLPFLRSLLSQNQSSVY
jgi:hypothetical protein